MDVCSFLIRTFDISPKTFLCIYYACLKVMINNYCVKCNRVFEFLFLDQLRYSSQSLSEFALRALLYLRYCDRARDPRSPDEIT